MRRDIKCVRVSPLASFLIKPLGFYHRCSTLMIFANPNRSPKSCLRPHPYQLASVSLSVTVGMNGSLIQAPCNPWA